MEVTAMYASLVFPAQTGRSLGQILPSSTLRRCHVFPLLSLMGAQGVGQQAAESGERQTRAGP